LLDLQAGGQLLVLKAGVKLWVLQAGGQSLVLQHERQLWVLPAEGRLLVLVSSCGSCRLQDSCFLMQVGRQLWVLQSEEKFLALQKLENSCWSCSLEDSCGSCRQKDSSRSWCLHGGQLLVLQPRGHEAMSPASLRIAVDRWGHNFERLEDNSWSSRL